VAIEVGAAGRIDTIPVRARVAHGNERDEIWARQVVEFPAFGDYEGRTGRTIPVIVLEPR
jgi:hypothetical protein